jgi:hypothetical protein
LLQPVYGLGIINDTFDRTTDEFYHLKMKTSRKLFRFARKALLRRKSWKLMTNIGILSVQKKDFTTLPNMKD